MNILRSIFAGAALLALPAEAHLARRLVAVRWRAVLLVAEGQRPKHGVSTGACHWSA
jgi:hypothetical protein